MKRYINMGEMLSNSIKANSWVEEFEFIFKDAFDDNRPGMNDGIPLIFLDIAPNNYLKKTSGYAFLLSSFKECKYLPNQCIVDVCFEEIEHDEVHFLFDIYDNFPQNVKKFNKENTFFSFNCVGFYYGKDGKYIEEFTDLTVKMNLMKLSHYQYPDDLDVLNEKSFSKKSIDDLISEKYSRIKVEDTSKEKDEKKPMAVFKTKPDEKEAKVYTEMFDKKDCPLDAIKKINSWLKINEKHKLIISIIKSTKNSKERYTEKYFNDITFKEEDNDLEIFFKDKSLNNTISFVLDEKRKKTPILKYDEKSIVITIADDVALRIFFVS